MKIRKARVIGNWKGHDIDEVVNASAPKQARLIASMKAGVPIDYKERRKLSKSSKIRVRWL